MEPVPALVKPMFSKRMRASIVSSACLTVAAAGWWSPPTMADVPAREAFVAAVVREHSDFARQATQQPVAQPAVQPTAQPAPPPGTQYVAQPFASPGPQPAAQPFAQGAVAPGANPYGDPILPTAPPAWPAEQATRPMPFTPDAQASAPRPTIEPAAPAPAGSPWLTAPSTSPNAAVVVAAAPAAPAAPLAPTAPATPEPEKKSASASFFTALQKPFTIFTKPKSSDSAAYPSTPASPPAPATAAGSTQRPAAPDPYGVMPLGLEGYCPVSLVEKGAWVEGRAQWGARHRGRTYLFAGAEQQQAFLATPDRYAPALSGDDPVLACDSGRQVAGQRRFGVTYQSRTYLFSSPETRAAFAANPQHYTTRVTIAERPMAPGTILR